MEHYKLVANTEPECIAELKYCISTVTKYKSIAISLINDFIANMTKNNIEKFIRDNAHDMDGVLEFNTLISDINWRTAYNGYSIKLLTTEDKDVKLLVIERLFTDVKIIVSQL